ncbi:UDP-N-acetylglucosamine 1-carboxyvinyltransferase, partial [endosymbiont of Metamasius hemipterus]|nr:UDP-N-acetylglucosamine 1-carboxyvinyltransferase [endosymbiont of Metamasius hemipterus]
REKYINIQTKNRPKSISIYTKPYPGFPTDIQPQICLLNSISSGMATIYENIFNNRFKHIYELNKMGAIFYFMNKKQIISNGVEKLYGANLIATDLRSAATLVLAGCIAEGKTIIDNINYLYRGYENFDIKLNLLGANIKKI